MEIPVYTVDAFTSRVFGGNPAAICPLADWLPDELLQAIAMEHNLSETAYFVGRGGRYHLRWFTPAFEVDLCGHATLAAAYVVFRELEPKLGEVVFDTRSGPLTVRRDGPRLVMDFPSRPPAPYEAPAWLADALGRPSAEVLASRDLFVVFDRERDVRELSPDIRRFAELPHLGVIVTAPGDECDFVSRFFAPRAGVDEDPVTGSAHSTLVPYWAAKLGRSSLHARQISRRGGELWCTLRGDRVTIAGEAVLFSQGTIRLL